ncbi:hypothetical protein amrb99_89270 [Actinomadura sp. RB99]|nr:hypothetical protein [Actinomadura sp. RB99]
MTGSIVPASMPEWYSTRRTRDAASRARRTPASQESRSPTTPRATGSSERPASVSATPWRLRSKSVTPISSSIRRIDLESAGWAMRSRSAARVKCSSSATATKYRSDRIATSMPEC